MPQARAMCPRAPAMNRSAYRRGPPPGDDVAVPWDIRVAPGERGAGIVPAPVRAAGDWACDHRLRWLAHDRDAERQRASLASTRRRAAHGAPSTSSPTRVAGRGV